MTVENIGRNLTSLRRVVYGLAFALAVVGVGLTALGLHVLGRQALANHRAEQQRRAICGILANIPGHVPSEIRDARHVFARPGHPGDCQPIPKTKPTPSNSQAGSSPQAQPTVYVIRPTPTPPPASPRPAPTRTPSPTPTRTPTSQPTPKPSPSGCHLLRDPLRCLPL